MSSLIRHNSSISRLVLASAISVLFIVPIICVGIKCAGSICASESNFDDDVLVGEKSKIVREW